MLVLTRQVRQRIFILDEKGDKPLITLEVLQVRKNSGQVRLGIDAPKGTIILREELYAPPEEEGAA